MNFLEKYNNKKNIRFNSFKFALIEAKNRGLKTLVETGCARGKTQFIFFSKKNWKDGMSTMIFSDYVKYVNGILTTCDIEAKNINNAKKFVAENKNSLVLLDDKGTKTSLSIEFMLKNNFKILNETKEQVLLTMI